MTEGTTVGFGLGEGEVHVRIPGVELARPIGALFPDYRKTEPREDACLHRLEVLRSAATDPKNPDVPEFSIHAPVGLLPGTDSGDARPDSSARSSRGAVTARGRIWMLTAVEALLARALLDTVSNRVHLHAAGVEVGEDALLALGAGGVGKSSLALSWSVMGLPVLGDDVVLVGPDGRAESFRRLFKVDPDRLRSHGVDPASTPAWSEAWSEAWFDPRVAGGWSGRALTVRVGVLLARVKARGSADADSGGPTLLEPADALAGLLASVVPTGLSRGAAVDPILRLLDGCDAYRLSFASSARAAARLVELARGRRPEGWSEGAAGRSSGRSSDPTGAASDHGRGESG